MGFWHTKAMHEMTTEEWESLCDGCAKCCILKYEDEDTGYIHQTDVVCHLLDIPNCRCTAYADRMTLVPDCVKITPDNILQLKWMPHSCSYRLIAEGKDLPDWHPLVTGDAESTHKHDRSVRGHVVSASEVDDPEERIIGWFDPDE